MMRIELKKISKVIADKIDYFICSASFEERSLMVSKHLNVENIKHSSVFINKDFVKFYGSNVEIVLQILKKTHPEKLYLNTTEPGDNAIIIYKYFDSISNIKKQKFLIDITTFTHETLLVLLKIIWIKKIPFKNITFIYNCASNYSINEKNHDKKWLSKGIGHIRNVIGYSGFYNPILSNHLIVLVGIEDERAKNLIDKLEPSTLSLGVSNDSCTNNVTPTRLNKKRHEALRNNYFGANSFQFTVTNPNRTAIIIDKIAHKYKQSNIILAPMNNKISTIGAGLFALNNNSVQICYATALQFNINGYSTPSKECYIFQIKNFK